MAKQKPVAAPDGKPRSDDAGGLGREVWKLFGLGFELAVTVALFAGAGWWLDQRYGWSPWALLILGMLGVCAGMYMFFKAALR